MKSLLIINIYIDNLPVDTHNYNDSYVTNEIDEVFKMINFRNSDVTNEFDKEFKMIQFKISRVVLATKLFCFVVQQVHVR